MGEQPSPPMRGAAGRRKPHHRGEPLGLTIVSPSRIPVLYGHLAPSLSWGALKLLDLFDKSSSFVSASLSGFLLLAGGWQKLREEGVINKK